MALLIDTDLLIDLERDAATPLQLGDEDRAISVITVSELLHGVQRAQGAVRTRRRAFVEHILAGIEAIPVTGPVARGLGVATRNTAHFECVRGQRVVTPGAAKRTTGVEPATFGLGSRRSAS